MTLQEKIAGKSHVKYLILFITLAMFAAAIVACGSNESTPKPTPTAAEPTDFPAGFPTPDPDELAACLADGGRWEVLGFSGPGCNYPTTDGGKSCRDSDECESACLGDPDLADELNSQNEENTGFCSPWQQNFGCQGWLEKGRYVTICVD